MAVADVERFSDLKGRIIRVRRDDPMGAIVAVGHPFKDRWYVPKERFDRLRKPIVRAGLEG